jgi:hypothetical protein
MVFAVLEFAESVYSVMKVLSPPRRGAGVFAAQLPPKPLPHA